MKFKRSQMRTTFKNKWGSKTNGLKASKPFFQISFVHTTEAGKIIEFLTSYQGDQMIM
jgi:hypothetical protein